MSFEENREDPWSGKGGPNHSKRAFLRAAVDCGAVMTSSSYGGVEVPYWGAGDHAKQLVEEGCLELSEHTLSFDLAEVKIWVPTEIGKILCR
jgi:hypothetical protein